jgi:hypothetical protein
MKKGKIALVGFPCDVEISPEELVGIDEHTREECRQSDFYFQELLTQITPPTSPMCDFEQPDGWCGGPDGCTDYHEYIAELAADDEIDERRIFDDSHCNHTPTT